MNTISLSTTFNTDVTIVSNTFIDTYMPSASGAYVKVYLYLLRCLSNSQEGLSISLIADHLEDTEKDIKRAISYWEKVSLLSVNRNSVGEITNIQINNIKEATPSIQNELAASEVATINTTPPQTEDVVTDAKFDKPVYSAAQIKELSNNDEVKWMMNIIEIYLERLLKPSDVQLILYLYESVGFSAELIMYLYEYCVSKNKRNTSYIEAVALSWAEEGIDTVEKAEANTTAYNSHYNAVNKAFGLNRAPGNIEKQFMNKWIAKYGFDIDIIVEACNRTILRTGKPDFNYADKILDNWHKKGVKQLKDIQKLDAEYAKTPSRNVTTTTTNANVKPSTNRFNAFPQRSYSEEDFSSMEQRLLNR